MSIGSTQDWSAVGKHSGEQTLLFCLMNFHAEALILYVWFICFSPWRNAGNIEDISFLIKMTRYHFYLYIFEYFLCICFFEVINFMYGEPLVIIHTGS